METIEITELNNTADSRQIIKRLCSLALPMSLSQLINVASGFLCMVMLSKLGHEVLAASALIFSTQMSVIVFGMSLLFSLSFLIGHAYGAKEYLTIGNYVQQGWTLALMISIPMMILFWNAGPLLIMFGQAKPIADIVQTFFHAYVWAPIPVMLAACNQQFGYGIHKQKLIITSSFLGVIVLLITANILIFGKWGMPKLGVAGLGYAMAAQSTFYVVFTTLFFYYSEFFKKFDLFTYRVHQNWGHVVKMFQVGWPVCMQIGGEMLSFFVGAAMVGWLGVNALAAYQVVNQYMFLIVIPVFALSQASGILIGQACGSKQFHEIKKLGSASVGLAFIMGLIVAAIFLIMPRYLAGLYLDIHKASNADTVHLIILLFAIVAVTQVIDGVRNVLTGMLRGLFDTRFPMYIGLVIIWLIGLPIGYLLAFTWHWGVIGMAVGSMIGIIIGGIIVVYRWRGLTRKYI